MWRKKNDVRKTGNRACAILIVIEKRTSLPNPGHVFSSCALISLACPMLSDVWVLFLVKWIWWVVNVRMVFSLIINVRMWDGKNNNAAPTNTINSKQCWIIFFPTRTWWGGSRSAGWWREMNINVYKYNKILKHFIISHVGKDENVPEHQNTHSMT